MLLERAKLGRYREFAAPADLRDIASAVWSFERPAGSAALPGSGHRLLPDTEISIAVETPAMRVVLIGPITKPRWFAPEAGYGEIAVRLRPEFCRDLFDIDPDAIADSVTPIRFRHVEPTFESLLHAVRTLRESRRISREAALAHAALRNLRALRGPTLRFSSIATALASSERHLRRIVTANCGLAPKQMQRIMRFNRAVLAGDRMDRPEWARIAADSGYYDQPHMIEEFRALAACTPEELRRERWQQEMAELSNRTAGAL